MKHLLIIAIILTSCGRHDEQEPETIPEWSDVTLKVQSYEKQIPKAQDEFGFVGVRCDSTTFSALLSAFNSNIEIDLHLAEREPGFWKRHAEECKPDNETSVDVYLMVLHWLLSRTDTDSAMVDLREIIARGESNFWIMGQGQFANISVLVPLIYKLESKLESKIHGDKMRFTDEIPMLKGHKPNINAMYILLDGRIDGYLNSMELAAMELLTIGSPRNIMFQAIYHRFKDGDFSNVAKLAAEDFGDEINLETGIYERWGSLPYFEALIVAYGIAIGI